MIKVRPSVESRARAAAAATAAAAAAASAPGPEVSATSLGPAHASMILRSLCLVAPAGGAAKAESYSLATICPAATAAALAAVRAAAAIKRNEIDR